MPRKTIAAPIYYVYALLREDLTTPFYIGMGRGDRWLYHEKSAHRTRSHKNNIILMMRRNRFTTIPKVKLAEGLLKAEAIALEIEFIAKFGRVPDGPLVNATRGGEGILGLSPEALKARAAAVAASQKRPEVRAKKSAAAKGRKFGPRSPEQRAKISAAVRGFRHTPEAKEKIRITSLGRRLSPESIEKGRQKRIGRKRSAATIIKMRAASTGRKQSDAVKEKHRIASTGRKHSATTIAKMRKIHRHRATTKRYDPKQCILPLNQKTDPSPNDKLSAPIDQ